MAISANKYTFIIIPVACSLLLAFSEPLWDHLEFKAYDIRVNLCRFFALGRQQPTGKVVMVAIEEHAALKKKPFIFWYPDLGRFLGVAAMAKARAVGVDMIPFHSLEQKLAESFKGMEGNIPSKETLDDIGRQLDNALVSGLMQASQETVIVQGISGSLVPFYYDVMAFMENVKPASLRVEADHDGILRSENSKLEKEHNGFVSQLYKASGMSAPEPDAFRINFNFVDKIPVYSFEDVVSDSFDRSKLSGKFIILGVKSVHEDVHDTPLGDRPGSLIHAAGLETLLTRSFPVKARMPLRFGAIVILALATFPLTRFRQPLVSFIWVAVLMLAYLSANVLLFTRGNDVPIFPQVLTPFAIFTSCYLYRYIVEERSKRQLYQTFSYYVDPMVIDRLITMDPEKLMKGEQREVCVMFLDIRGFTALSEKISSEALVSLLNIFFGKVSEVVQSQNGFVNKFIGDGMLAFFAVGDHYVDDALQASKGICLATEYLNESGELKQFIGDGSLGIGIGLHCGKVILGNIGSQRKLDFTVIGRPVNTASRIESLTKQYARPILVSDTVVTAAGEQFSFEPLGHVEVRGVEDGVFLFALNL